MVAMELDRLRKVDVGHDVGGNHEECLLQHLPCKSDGAGRAQVLLACHILDLHAELAPVAKVPADGVRLMVQDDDQIVETVFLEQAHDVEHHGTVRERDHRLRQVHGQRSQAGAESAGQNDCLHTDTSIDL